VSDPIPAVYAQDRAAFLHDRLRVNNDPARRDARQIWAQPP
jgi:hypothetical protein